MSEGNAETARLRAVHLGPERRKPQILDAALALALDHGTESVTIKALAEQMDVTRPVIYACFASREELLNALIEREEKRLFVGVMSTLPNWPVHNNIEDVLTEGFKALLQVIESNVRSWQLVFAARPDTEVAERFGRARRLVAERVAQVMQPILALHGVQDIEAKLPILVEMFMSMGDGAVRALIQNESKWTSERLGAYIGRLVFGALSQA